MTWYAVHTNVRAEHAVHLQLDRLGLDTLYLHYRDTRKHARKKIGILKAYFPRYLFVDVLADESLYPVNHTPGVSTVLYNGDVPLEIPADVIEELRTRGDDNGLVGMTKRQRMRWMRGQRLRIGDGPLAGFIGLVELDSGTAVTLWVEMFKRSSRSSFDPQILSPVGRSLS